MYIEPLHALTGYSIAAHLHRHAAHEFRVSPLKNITTSRPSDCHQPTLRAPVQWKWVSGDALLTGAELLNVEHCDHRVSSAGWGEAVTPTPIVGWELNLRGKTGARMVDLGPTMDPRQLASAAVDLNLRLMRWRAAPALDTARLAATKCLLLGAGTDLLSFARPCLQQRREQLSRLGVSFDFKTAGCPHARRSLAFPHHRISKVAMLHGGWNAYQLALSASSSPVSQAPSGASSTMHHGKDTINCA